MATSAPTRQCVNENRWSIWSFILLSLWQGNVCIPVSSSKCWTCDSIKGPFPLVSAFLNYLLTQIWSLLNPNPDLVSWLATPQNAEWVIYQFLEWWETKWFMAHLSLSFFFTQILFMSLLLLLSWSPCLSLLLSPSEVISVIITMYAISSEKPCVIPERKYEWSEAGCLWNQLSHNTDTRQPWHVFLAGHMKTCSQVHIEKNTHVQCQTELMHRSKHCQMQVIAYPRFHGECIGWIKHLWIKAYIDLNITVNRS